MQVYLFAKYICRVHRWLSLSLHVFLLQYSYFRNLLALLTKENVKLNVFRYKNEGVVIKILRN